MPFNKIRKSVFASLLAAMMICTFTACSKTEEIVPGSLDPEGNLVPYTTSTVSYGGVYYIKRGEDTYYPLCGYGMDDDLQWFTATYNNFIPTFKNGDTLVYINSSERPSSTTIVAMEDTGYTIGTRFEVFTENGENVVRFTDESCEFSPVGSYINTAVSDDYGAVKITEINGKPFTRNMVNGNGLIQGLTEGAMYKFNFYSGTVYHNVSLKADTKVFTPSTEYSSTSYKAMKNIFYEVVLPENLPNGYYQIPGFGLFRYELEDNIVLPNGIEVVQLPDETDENPETEASSTPVETTENV